MSVEVNWELASNLVWLEGSLHQPGSSQVLPVFENGATNSEVKHIFLNKLIDRAGKYCLWLQQLPSALLLAQDASTSGKKVTIWFGFCWDFEFWNRTKMPEVTLLLQSVWVTLS